MKRFSCVLSLALSFSFILPLAGCKPDAAVRRGAVVGAGPSTSEKDVRKPGTTIITQPSTDKTPPLKKVQ